jgi:hypothetical protein
MPDDDKTKRAQEIDAAIKAHDAKKRDDAHNDLAKDRLPGSVEGQPLDKMLATLDACAKAMDSMSSRLDALEAHHKKRDDHHDDDEETEEERKRREAGEAKEVVADSAHRGEFLDVQSRAEKAYLGWGMRANPPLAGETLRNYRLRLLRPMQRHSKQYSKSDLELLPRDEAIFGATEAAIYADSIAASSSPDSVPRGQLRMIVKRLPSGHIENTFIGEPAAWMDRFAGGSRRYVTRINTKWSGNPE